MFRSLRLSGFTLVEILTVLAIIGILSTLSIGPIRSAQRRTRDSQRKTDLNLIAQSLDLYYSENRTLPDDGTKCVYLSTDKAPWIPGLTSRYLPSSNGKVLPLDPAKKNADLFYTYTNYLTKRSDPDCLTTGGESFKLEAILENTKDSDGVLNDDGKLVYEVVR